VREKEEGCYQRCGSHNMRVKDNAAWVSKFEHVRERRWSLPFRLWVAAEGFEERVNVMKAVFKGD